MSDKIICNASPLIFLSQLGRLHLLNDLFDETLVPSSAWDEAVFKPDDVSKDLSKMRSSGDLNVFTVNNKTAVSAMIGRLHIGEVEVIVGAGELGIPNVILDDGYARNKAKQMGLYVTGTLGILIAARYKGVISDIDTEIDNLLNYGFRIDESLIEHVRKMFRK